MSAWPLAHEALGRTYRLCPHGVAHPDPDDVEWGPAEHECDRCCVPPRPPGIALDVGGWVPGVLTHTPKACDGGPCPMHDPSRHALRDAPAFHGDSSGLTMRRCVHGVFHPDPDDVRWRDRTHACDGCCVASPSGR